MGKFYESVYEGLRLYIRQCAWLNATPKRQGIEHGTQQSRLQTFKDEDVPIELPEVEVGYLVAYLWDVGPTLKSSGGESPLTHGEILAWQQLQGIELQPWETRILIRLSFDYLVQSQKSEKFDCIAPYMKMKGRAMRKHVAKKVDELFG